MCHQPPQLVFSISHCILYSTPTFGLFIIKKNMIPQHEIVWTAAKSGSGIWTTFVDILEDLKEN